MSLETPDVKIALIGNVDSGKSTLVGVLCKGVLDDGRGSARSLVFNFEHEQANGRTSSIATELLGFSGDSSAPVTGLKRADWPRISAESKKVVTFMDLCGHERYLKTTIFGLTGLHPDYAMIVVNANAGLQRMSREHLGIALGLEIPVIVLVTKIDMTPPPLISETIADIQKVLKAVGKLPVIMRAVDAINDSSLPTAESSNLVQSIGRVVPIFPVSSVSGEGLPQLRSFLGLLEHRNQADSCSASTSCDETIPSPITQFHIDSSFTVPGVGTVVSGSLLTGRITSNAPLLLGPDKNGNFMPVSVRSIQHRRVPVDSVSAGAACALALKSKTPLKKQSIRKGMVLLSSEVSPKAHWDFDVEVQILHHSTTIKAGYQAIVHSGVVRQTARVVGLEGMKWSTRNSRTGDRVKFHMKFCFFPEFIQPGDRVVLREGRTKAIGRVVAVGDSAILGTSAIVT